METGCQVDAWRCNCASHYIVCHANFASFGRSDYHFEGEDDLNAIDFVHDDTNLAARAIHRYFGLLHNQEDPFWLPWVAHTQFDDEGLCSR